MDTTDREILRLLAGDARMTVSKLSSKLRVARSTVQTRLERLENSGAIAGYTIRLGTELSKGRIRATVLLTVEPRAQPAVLARLKAIGAVEIVHTASGRFDMILQVATQSTAELDAVLDQIGDIQGIKSSESLIHLSTRIDRAI